MNQYLPGDHGMFPAPIGESMPADPRIFSLEDEQSKRKPLLRNMHKMRQMVRAKVKATAVSEEV